MKKLLSLMLALSMLLGCLSFAAAEGNDVIEINIYHHMSTDTARGQATEKLLEMFNEAYAGQYKAVSSVNPDFPTYQEKVKAMIAANETPDIFCYNFNPNDLSRQESGKLMDFTPYMDEAWKACFKESDLELLTLDGHLYSIPRAQQSAVFYYNTELLAAAGYDHFPTTWDEFYACCEALKANNVSAISLYTADDAWYATCFLTYAFASYAGSTVANSGVIDCEEMVKAAADLQKVWQYTTNDAVGANYSVASNNFANGKTAMIIDGPWLMGSLPEDIAGKVAVAAAPNFEGGAIQDNYQVTDAQSPWAAAAQADPAKAEAIVALLKYLTSEEAAKIYTLEGSEYQSARMTLTDEDKAGMTLLQLGYYELYATGTENVVNVQRNLSTAANSALPSLVESLVLGEISAADFAAQLDAENAY